MAAKNKAREKTSDRNAAKDFSNKKSGAKQAPDTKAARNAKKYAASADVEEITGEAVDESGEAIDENVKGPKKVKKSKTKKGDKNHKGGKRDLNETEAAKLETAVAKKLAAEMQDRFMRLQAEWDNFRKRTAAEQKDLRARASESLVTDILPVLDDLDRAIAHAKETGDGGSLTGGVEAIENKLLTVLGKHNVEEIEAQGLPLDLNKHQAVGTQEDASVAEETVINVFQKGYMIGEKVLRPAMVITSVGGPAREKTEEE